MRRWGTLLGNLVVSAAVSLGVVWAAGPRLAPAAGLSAPIASAITYQGQLTQNGTAVNGQCDFQFSLFDAVSGGALTAGPVDQTLAVTGGLFTARIDFGAGAFAGQQRFIEVATRCPAGSGTFSTVSPRGELTASPYAIFAQTAASVPFSGVSGLPSGAFVPSGVSLLGTSPIPPAGYVWSGLTTFAGDFWEQRRALTGTAAATDVPAPRGRHGVVELGGKIYIVGGLEENGNALGDLWRYDPATNGYQRLADLPLVAGQRRAEFATVAAGGKIYVIGGQYGGTPTGELCEYDPATNLWRIRTSQALPVAAIRPIATTINGALYVGGGTDGNLLTPTYYLTFRALDPSNDLNIWQSLPNSPYLVIDSSLTALDGKLYLIGGQALTLPFAVMSNFYHEWDPANPGAWTLKGTLSSARMAHSAVAFGNRIYLIGGRPTPVATPTPVLFNTTVEELDPVTGLWAVRQSLAVPRANAGALAVGGQIFHFSGYRSEAYTPFYTAQVTPFLDVYTPSTPLYPFTKQ